jgi:hypothetical protein
MDVAESKQKPEPTKVAASTPELAGLSDDELLQMRICDLKLKIPGTELESRIQKFYGRMRDHRHPFLSRPPTTEKARREDDDGSGGRHRSVVHEPFAP